MQGRPNQGKEPWDKSSSQRTAALNGTGKQRAIPQRPPGMARIEQPPTTQRVARPKREAPKPRQLRRRFMVLGSIFIAFALFACVGSYIAYNMFSAISASAGAATTASSFLTALQQQDYAQAYRNLGPSITLSTPQEQFVQQAQLADRCYGPIKSFSEDAGSAVTQNNAQSYTYTMTRSKLKDSYKMRLTVQQDQDGNGWKITDYGNALGPDQGAQPCK